MKKIVQRFALALLLLLPMLASATITNAVANLPACGTVTFGNAQGTAGYDTVYAVPNTHYQVNGWLNVATTLTPDGSTIIQDGNNLLLDKNQTWNITVMFGNMEYHVGIDPAIENGTISGLPADVPYGDEITIEAMPDPGFQFGSWADDPTAPNPRTFHVTGAATLLANFIPQTYNLTVTTNATDISVTIRIPSTSPYTFDETYDLTTETIPPIPVEYGQSVRAIVTTNDHFGTPISWYWDVTGTPELLGTGTVKNRAIASFPAADATLDIQLTPATITVEAISTAPTVGTVSGAGDYGYGEQVTLTATVTNDGYKFDYWANSLNSDTSHANPLEFNAEQNVSYVAYFDHKHFPINLTADPAAAGSFTVDGSTYDPEATYVYESDHEIEAVGNSHWVFSKWSDDETDNPRTVYMWDTVNLTALFVPDTHTVTIASSTHATFSPIAGTYADVAHDSAFTVAIDALTAEDEYVLDHWEDGNGNTVTFPLTITDDVTLTAVFQGVEYTINAVTNTGDESEGSVSPATQTVVFGESFSLTATPATGYEFKHWNEPTLGDKTALEMTGATLEDANTSHTYTWTASFGPIGYDVTVAALDATYGTLDPTGVNTVSYGNTFSVTYTSSDVTKYELVGWKDNHDNTLAMPLTITSDTTVEAVIDSVAYTLTLTNATIAGNVTSVKYNTAFTLTPATIAGKTFKNWKVNDVDGSTDPDYEFTMTNANMAIEAIYEDVTYYVHATASPVEGGTITGTGDAFAYNATTSLTATANDHYTFTKWNDDVTDNPRTVTVVSDTNFTAVFTAESYTITVAVNDPVMGSASTSEAEAEYNTVILPFLTATPNPAGGYYLKCWLDQNGDTINADYHIAMNVVATAVFGYSDMDIVTYAAEYGDTTSHQDAWGSITVDGVAVYTGEITLTASANTHYNFKGWSDGINDNPRTFILTRDTIFYAFFAPDTHAVTLTVNDENMGAITGFTGTQAAYGSIINVTAEPNTAAHYHFIKWSDNTTDAAHAAITVEDDVTLQAIFGIDTVTVTAANTDGFGTFTPAAAVEVGYGSTVTLNATANHGYKFQKWSNGTTDITTNPYELTATDDETWTVSFELDQFTVTTVAVPAHAAATLTGAGDYGYLTDVTVAATAATGYVLTGYEDENGNAVLMPISLTDDTTVYAVFDSVTVAITAVSNNDTWGTVTPASASAKYNTTFHVTAAPEPGYELVSWNDGSTTYPAVSLDTNFRVPATDVTYTATFAAGEFEVAGVVADACTEMGTVTGTATAAYGSTVTLTATANDGYTFVNWDGDALLTDASHAFAVGTTNTTHTAYFEPITYTLTIDNNAPVRGHVENAGANVTSMPVAFGSTVNLTAVSHTGYDFDKWVTIHGNDSTDANISFVYNIAGPATLTANFKYHMWEVTVNGTNGATVSGDGSYANGAEATLTAAPALHYTVWKGWKNVAGDTVSTDNPLTVTVLSDTALTAIYDVDTHDVAFTVLPAASYGTITSGTDGRYTYGSQITLTAAPVDPLHYSFVKWEDNSTAAERTVTVEGDTTFTATFEADKYQFTVSSDNTEMGTVTGTASGSYDYNTEISVNVTANTGYHFVKWVDANGDSITNELPYTFNIDRDSTIMAVFTNDLYTLRVSAAPLKEMGYIMINGDSLNYVTNGYVEKQLPTHTDITVLAMPNSGYKFGSWSDAPAVTDSVRTIQLTGNTTITATFDYHHYDIHLAVNDAARGEATFEGTYNNYYGAKDTIKATANPGFVFVRWDDGMTTNPRIVFVSEEITYTAIFANDVNNIADNACDSVVWDGTTYYASEVVEKTYTDYLGLDSVVVNNITVRHSTTGTDSYTRCYDNPLTWIDGNTYAESNNTAVDTILNVAGCDSIVTLNLVVNEQQGTKVVLNACSPYTWDINGHAAAHTDIVVEGTYYDEGVDVNGCAKLDTLVLTFMDPEPIVDVIEACDSYTWTINGVDYEFDNSTTHHVEFTDAETGCENTADLTLTIKNSQTVAVDPVTACDSYDWNNIHSEASDNLSYTTTGANGCDSTTTLVLTINYSNTGDTSATVCDNFTWYGVSYNASATPSHLYTNAAGCDSTVTLNLTVNHSSTGVDVQNECDTYTWINGETYTASTSTPEHLFANGNMFGCDSTVTLNLTIRNSNTGVDVQDVCDTYTWINGETYTASTNTPEYTLAGANQAGCDSTVTLNLTIRNKVTVSEETTVCDSYEWNGITFTESGNIVMNGTAANGCDSTTTLHLNIQHTINATLDPVAACDEYEWNFNGTTVGTYTTSGDKTYEYAEGVCEHNTATLPLTINTLADVEETNMGCESYTWNIASTGESFTYTEGGDKVETITDANGCTATATLHLTINSNPAIEQTAEACSSYDWNVNNQTFHYTTSGDHVETITLDNCTGTATLHLTIHTPEAGINTPATICEGATYTWTANNQEYTEANTYYYDYTDANNCPVQDTLVLTVNAVVAGINTAEAICEGAVYTWAANNQEYTEANTYYYDYTDANNCPVQDTLVLTVNTPAAGVNVAEAVCEGATFTWHNNPYTAAGEYYYNYTDANNCAVVDTLTLTVNTPAASQNVAEAICEGESYTWNNTAYTTAGIYTFNNTDANGCTVIDTLTLTVNTPAAGTNTAEAICAGESYTWNNTTYTTAGTYTYNSTDANGCTVTNTLVLTVNTPAAGTNTTEAICAGESYTWNNTQYTAAGTYTNNTTDANGCTVTNTLTLTVNQPQNTTVAETACDSYTWSQNSQSYTVSGAYTATFTDANGCSATATLNLTVNQSVTSAVALSDTGSVVFNGVTYTADTVVTVTYTAANGCDSTVTATITVIPEIVEPSIMVVAMVDYAMPYGTISNSGSSFAHIGDSIEYLATPDSGYLFDYYSVAYINNDTSVNDTVYTNPFTLYIDSAMVTDYSMVLVKAAFISISGTVDSLTLIVATNDVAMGTTNPAPGTYRLGVGDNMEVTYIANDGYHFDHWEYITEDTDTTYTYTSTDDTVNVLGYAMNMQSTIYLTAYFAADSTPVDTNYYYVTLVSADAVMGTVSASDSVLAGAIFTATATANEGYHFTAWTSVAGDTISTMNPYTFIVDSDITLVANFEADPQPVYYTVSVNYDATMGSVSGAGSFEAGSTVTLIATANDGYRFVNWTKDGNVMSTDAMYAFTLTGDVTLTANFEAEPVYYTVTVMANDANMGEVHGSGYYQENTTVTIFAEAYSGYHFVNWTDANGNVVETAISFDLTVTADATYIAVFEADEPGAVSEADMENVTIYSTDTRIIVRGAEGKTVNVYDINGRTVSSEMNASENVEFRMASTGVYLVKVGNAPAKRVLVVR